MRERERECVRARRAVRNTDHREATLSMGLGVAGGGARVDRVDGVVPTGGRMVSSRKEGRRRKGGMR